MAWEARRRGQSRPSTAAPRLKTSSRPSLLPSDSTPDSVVVHNPSALATLLSVVRPPTPPSPATSSVTSTTSSTAQPQRPVSTGSGSGRGSRTPPVPPPPPTSAGPGSGPSTGRSVLAAAQRGSRVSSAPPTQTATAAPRLSRPRTASGGGRRRPLHRTPSLPFKALSSSSSRPSTADRSGLGLGLGLGLPPRLPTPTSYSYSAASASASASSSSVSETLQRSVAADSLLSILSGSGRLDGLEGSAGSGAGAGAGKGGRGGSAGSKGSAGGVTPSSVVDLHSALCVAADGGQVETVKRLLNGRRRLPVLNEGRTMDGYTPLHCASSRGHWAVVLALLAAGSNANAVTLSGDTALHMAAYAGSVNAVDILVDFNANINAGNEYGEVPLAHAARRGHARVVRQLCRLGADVLVQDRLDDTPAQQAADKLTLSAFDTPPSVQGPLGRLPWVALVAGFEYLDTQSLGRVACVCGKWRRVMDEEGSRLFKAVGGERGRGKWELSLNSLMGFGTPAMAQFRPPSGRSKRSSGRRTPTPSPTPPS